MVMDLRPNNVPPNTLCEVLIQNISSDKAFYAGARQEGFTLDRKIKLSLKKSMTLLVKTDSNSQTETYVEDNANIKFAVMGSFRTVFYD